MAKIAVVTGGQGALGLALKSALEAEHYTVYNPGHPELDVDNEEVVYPWFKKHSRIDLLINNAGCLCDQLAVRLSEADWNRVLETNLRGAFLCTKAVLPMMLKQRSGHIVQISSYSARSGTIGQAAYAAAKAGVIGFTKSIAKEGGRRNVRANAILPGYLKTPFTKNVSSEVEASHLRNHVLNRFNTVEEAARFIVFLDSMQHVSGQVFQLDSRVSST